MRDKLALPRVSTNLPSAAPAAEGGAGGGAGAAAAAPGTVSAALRQALAAFAAAARAVDGVLVAEAAGAAFRWVWRSLASDKQARVRLGFGRGGAAFGARSDDRIQHRWGLPFLFSRTSAFAPAPAPPQFGAYLCSIDRPPRWVP